MDNNTVNNDNKNTDMKRPNKGAVPAVALLTVLFSVMLFLSLRMGQVILLIPNFVAAAAFQTYLLYFVRNPFTLLVPCLASFLCVPHFLPAFICLCALLVCSAVFALTLMHQTESFRFFMLCALMYSLLAGAAYVLLMIEAFGSFDAGLEALSGLLSETLNSIFGGLDEELRVALPELADEFVLMLPSVVCGLGIFAAWVTKWILSAVSALTGLKDRLFSRITGAPVGLAVIFVLLMLFGILFAFSDESVYFASLNLRSVLSVIFMGEGVREYIAVLRTRGDARKKHLFIIIGVALVVFPSLLVNVAAYYGAYCAMFKKIHLIKPRQK